MPERLVVNPRVDRSGTYPEPLKSILSLAGAEAAAAVIRQWDGYAPTPVHDLTGLARDCGIGQLLYKDEGARFGLGSFKSLGGAYAVERVVAHHGRDGLVVTSATDGNHGRAVAWGAARAGIKAVIYVHEHVSEGRAEAIRRLGATVVREGANYDASVRAAAEAAGRHGWQVISDTSWPGYTEVPRDIMQGYVLLALEAEVQAPPPTHIFIQGGVGGVAAAVISHAWERWGAARPNIIVVEPVNAACLLDSAVAGRVVTVGGALDTIIAGLACGEPSLLAWEIVGRGADAFLTVTDDEVRSAMRRLAMAGIVGGESGVAGIAALLSGAGDPEFRRALGLTPAARVLCYGTEGATDPALYADIVGHSPDEVRA